MVTPSNIGIKTLGQALGFTAESMNAPVKESHRELQDSVGRISEGAVSVVEAMTGGGHGIVGPSDGPEM